jgi:hypothetical protein
VPLRQWEVKDGAAARRTRSTSPHPGRHSSRNTSLTRLPVVVVVRIRTVRRPTLSGSPKRSAERGTTMSNGGLQRLAVVFGVPANTVVLLRSTVTPKPPAPA